MFVPVNRYSKAFGAYGGIVRVDVFKTPLRFPAGKFPYQPPEDPGKLEDIHLCREWVDRNIDGRLLASCRALDPMAWLAHVAVEEAKESGQCTVTVSAAIFLRLARQSSRAVDGSVTASRVLSLRCGPCPMPPHRAQDRRCCVRPQGIALVSAPEPQ